jgi:cyclophilin family peptidyl-prolyl cis-trans isomerase
MHRAGGGSGVKGRDSYHLNDDNDDTNNDNDDIDDKKKRLPIARVTFVGIIITLILAVCYISGDLKIALNMLKDYRSPMDTLHAGEIVSIVDNKQLQVQQQVKQQVQQQTSPPTESLIEKQKGIATDIITKVRALKRSGIVMETDENAKSQIAILQKEVKQLLYLQYGPGPYKVLMELEFPSTMPDYNEKGKKGEITIELAPIELVPYSVYYFLEIIKNWKGGAFHRVAGHVLQSMVHGPGEGLAFQEYNPLFPHKKLTLGYAGRPGGPAFYISTVDNVLNHGPGSQGSKTEADGCFGTVIGGFDIVERIKLQPGRTKPSGFIDKRENYIKIVKLTLL